MLALEGASYGIVSMFNHKHLKGCQEVMLIKLITSNTQQAK